MFFRYLYLLLFFSFVFVSFINFISLIFLDVCALRLDFETFTTAGPTGGSDNTAAIDTFQVTAVRL